jgi:hypothetical protein
MSMGQLSESQPEWYAPKLPVAVICHVDTGIAPIAFRWRKDISAESPRSFPLRVVCA